MAFGKVLWILALFGLGAAFGGCSDSTFSGASNRTDKPAAKAVAATASPSPTSAKVADAPPDTDQSEATMPHDNVNPESDAKTSNKSDSPHKSDDAKPANVPLVNNETTAQASADEIVFGPDKLFHIGDGQFDDSSCKMRVQTLGVAGVRYVFEFDVAKDATRVEISIQTLCGVDTSDSNAITLMRGASVLFTQMLMRNATSVTLPSQSLSKDHYRLEVESRAGSKRLDSNDHDDYLIGQVRLKGTGPLHPGHVGAE